MQPILRQVPPRTSRLSMMAVFKPSCAARIAPVYPAGPPPRTMISNDTMPLWLTQRGEGSMREFGRQKTEVRNQKSEYRTSDGERRTANGERFFDDRMA